MKVKGNKSPYDGDWTYWASRIGKHPRVRKEVATLLKRQKNQCAHCGLTCQPTDLIDVEHIVPKSQGGDDTLKNKQVLHRHGHESQIAEDIKAASH